MSQGPDTSGSPEPANLAHALLDLDLRTFAGPRLFKIMYVVGMVLLGLSALAGFVTWTSSGGTGIFVGLFVVALMGLFLLFLRVGLEVTKLLYRIADDVASLAAQTRAQPFIGVPAAGSGADGLFASRAASAAAVPTLAADTAAVGAFGEALAPAGAAVSASSTGVPAASSPRTDPAADAGELYPSPAYAAQVEFGRQAAYAAVQAEYAARSGSGPSRLGADLAPAVAGEPGVRLEGQQSEDAAGRPAYPAAAQYDAGYPTQVGYPVPAQAPPAEYGQAAPAPAAQAEYAQADYAQADYAQAEYAQGHYGAAEYGQAEYGSPEYGGPGGNRSDYAEKDYFRAARPAQEYPQEYGQVHEYGQTAGYAAQPEYPQQYAQAPYTQADFGPGGYPQQPSPFTQTERAGAQYVQGDYATGEYDQAGHGRQAYEGHTDHTGYQALPSRTTRKANASEEGEGRSGRIPPAGR